MKGRDEEGRRAKEGSRSEPGDSDLAQRQVGRCSSYNRTWWFPCELALPGESHGINQCQTVSAFFGVLMESSR